MKAKTTDKRTREVKKKKIQFQATLSGKSVGSASTCDLHVDDSNVSAIHARVGMGEDGNAYIHTTGRTYFLIGACAGACGVWGTYIRGWLCTGAVSPVFVLMRGVLGAAVNDFAHSCCHWVCWSWQFV